MAEINTNSISSGNYNDLKDSVISSRNNKLLLDNISKIYNYNNVIELPMNFLRKYENILKNNLIEIDLSPSYYYRPEYLSQEVFDTTDLWYLILFVNDMKSPLEFCTPKILIPSSYYAMEIVNKIKNIEEDIETSHKQPINVERHLLKDVNFSSDEIIKISNNFRQKVTDDYVDSIDVIIGGKTSNRRFYCTQYILKENYATNSNNEILPTLLPKCLNVFNDNKKGVISLPTDSSLVNEFNNNEEYNYNIFLNHNENYVLLKNYNGLSDFRIKDLNDDTFEMNLTRNKNENKFYQPIMTYDMREATRFSETDENEIKHSNEIWCFNNEEDLNEEILDLLNPYENNEFSEVTFNNEFGGYLRTTTFNCDNKEEKIKTIFCLKLDLTNDLETNKININDYEFLGFSLYYYFKNGNNEEVSFSPLSITYEIFTGEYDKDKNEVIEFKTFTLPFDKELYKTDQVKNIKRILPIITNCETKERLNIKNIYISCQIKEDGISENIMLGLSGIEIYGFKYEDIVREFQIPDNKISQNYILNYSYNYKNKYEGFYFEPSIFKRDSNIIEELIDGNNFNSKKITSFLSNNFETNFINNNEIELKSKDDNYPSKSTVIDYLLEKFNFDYNFILELEVNLNNEGFIKGEMSKAISFKFDINENEGYIVHIGDFSEEIKDLNYFKDTQQHVLSTGCYRLTDNGSSNSKIFKDVESLKLNYHQIYITNEKIFGSEEDYKDYKLKISKYGNLISIDYSIKNEDNEYESYKNLYNFTDYFYGYSNKKEYDSDIKTKHQFGFTTYYNLGGKIKILNYLIGDEN